MSARETKLTNVRVAGTLGVDGAVDIAGALGVDGAATLGDDATVAGTLGVTGLTTLTGGVALVNEAITVTADGTGTGTIAGGGNIVIVVPTSDDADKIAVLPAPVPGTIVVLLGAATGYELRSSAPATVAINGGAEANAESAIAAGVTVVAICESATAWKAFGMASDGTLAQVAAAAAA